MASERRERAHGTTAWVVGVVATPLTHTHAPAWVAPQWAAVRGATTLTRTQRTGRGSTHSGGGWWERRTVVVAATPHTQPPPPRAHHPVCVCVNREWTAPAQPVSGPSGHTRHNTHAATTTSTTTSSSSSKRRSGVVWGTRSGWTCEWRARRGHSQHRGHTHTRHQSAPATTCVCVWHGGVAWLCACVSGKGWTHGQEEDRDWDWVVKRGGWVVKD